jgi:hypothetical protein
MSTKVPTPICTPKWVLEWWRTSQDQKEQKNKETIVRNACAVRMVVVVEQSQSTVQNGCGCRTITKVQYKMYIAQIKSHIVLCDGTWLIGCGTWLVC